MALQEKHTPFFNLLDAVQSGGCPVCYRGRLRVNQFFETLLYQNVNNRSLRADLRNNGGFCAPHAHQLATHNDGLAVAIMHLELLEAAEKNGGRARIPASQRAKSGGSGCPACRIAQEESGTTVGLLIQYGDDDQFIEVYQNAAGLCLPHFERLKERAKHPPQVIAERQQTRLSALIAQTRKFIDGENVAARVRPELSREDRLVWKKIILWYYGLPGIVD